MGRVSKNRLLVLVQKFEAGTRRGGDVEAARGFGLAGCNVMSKEP